jgi:hypothetical protein
MGEIMRTFGLKLALLVLVACCGAWTSAQALGNDGQPSRGKSLDRLDTNGGGHKKGHKRHKKHKDDCDDDFRHHDDGCDDDDGGPGTVDNPLVIHVIAETTEINYYLYLAGGPPRRSGDTYIYSHRLYFPEAPTVPIGHADGHCTLIDPFQQTYSCTTISSLPDGDIMTAGLLVFIPGATSPGAVLGGTGEYKTARGDTELVLGPKIGSVGARHEASFSLILKP